MFNSGEFFRAFFVHEVNTGGIGWVSVSDKANFLFRIRGPDGLVHCDDGGQGFTGVSEVIGRKYQVL